MHSITAGDCRTVMGSMAPESVDAIVSDPPYGLAFMGRGWDHELPGPEYWEAAWRVAKPGAHLIAFGGTRTWHRLVCAIEDAGWEIRDSLLWLYGQGMPKGEDLAKAFDRRRDRKDLDAILQFTAAVRAARDAAGKTNRQIDELFGMHGMAGHWTSTASQPAIPSVEQWPILRDFLGLGPELDAEAWRLNGRKGKPGPDWEKRPVLGVVRVTAEPFVPGGGGRKVDYAITASATEEAKAWEGWNTQLKPGWEPIVLARKPMIGTLLQNVARFGTGAINIGASRVGDSGGTRGTNYPGTGLLGMGGKATIESLDAGRYPANVVIDDEVAADLDATVGVKRSGIVTPGAAPTTANTYGAPGERSLTCYGDTGGVSRYFYNAKATKRERSLGAVVNGHETVKPIALMRWLVRMVTPPGGLCFDPFTGSGSTGVAAALEGFRFAGAELDPAHAETARRRIEACGFEVDDPPEERPEAPAPAQGSLF